MREPLQVTEAISRAWSPKCLGDTLGFVEVPLTNGGVAIVSECDATVVMQFAWRRGSNGYIYCRVRKGQKHALLHRLVLDVAGDLEVHHVNRCKHDCRRENLIAETPAAHQTKHHASELVARSNARRIYPEVRDCAGCGTTFRVHPDHRGRNRFCSRDCGNKNRGVASVGLLSSSMQGAQR